MRRLAASVAVVALVLTSVAPAIAATETVTGKIVDQSCYMKDCAVACAKKGQPMALLTTDGKVYTITGGLAAENNAKLVPHMSHTMALTGEVTDVKGVKSISVAAAGLKMVSK